MTDDPRTEMIQILRALVEGTPPEEDEGAAVARLLSLSPDPEFLDYVFHAVPKTDVSQDAAVDRSLAYRTITL